MNLTKVSDFPGGVSVIADNGKSYVLLDTQFVEKYDRLVMQVERLTKQVEWLDDWISSIENRDYDE
jgi:hypothetical protein